MHATLVFDAPLRPCFDGSCAVVAYFLRNSLRALGYKVLEQYVPIGDAKTAIPLRRPARPSPDDIRVVFEEIFTRYASSTDLAGARNISFFNILSLRNIENHRFADVALMNSPFMEAALRTELAIRDLPGPARVESVPLPLPLLAFPDGYPSVGGRIARPELRAMAKHAFIGHALRIRKANPFATLSIVYHLNAIAVERGIKPFYLLLPEFDHARFEQALPAVPVPADTLDYFVPVAFLNNRSMTWVMRHTSFGLCYDDFVEPFGYYPLESVYVGCPIFTNGVGNLRHLLPKHHGIYVDENFAMYGGTASERVAAYRTVAESIVAVVTASPDGSCARGADYIRRHHAPERLTESLGLCLQESGQRERPGRPHVRMSPYLRLADWDAGNFVTDDGIVMNDPRASRWRTMLEANAPPSAVRHHDLDHRIITVW